MDVLESFSLLGKTAVVTGGGGLYGRQIAEALAEGGAKTFIASRGVEQLQEQARQFRDRGLNVNALTLDQSDESSIDGLLKTVCEMADRVDVLVNNAVLRPMKNFDSPAADFAKSMDVNSTGIFMMTRAFGQWMAVHGGGSIINIGSIQGLVGPDFSLYEGVNWVPPPDYFFHKGGMLQLTRYAASLFGSRGVRVNMLSPGGFLSGQDEIQIQRYNARTLLGRMANDSDLKGAVLFLASGASSYVTGANIVIDGGYTAI